MLSDEQKAEKLAEIGEEFAKKRDEFVAARKESGIEEVWMDCEEAYLGIDNTNRSEFGGARWAKPTAMQGPLTSQPPARDEIRSNAYVRLTSRYVDVAAAKLAEILLPIDDKAFKFGPTPIPDMV